MKQEHEGVSVFGAYIRGSCQRQILLGGGVKWLRIY